MVASRLCGLPYMIEEGRTGFLVNSDDEVEIAARLIDMLRNDHFKHEMGERCRAVAMERFHARAVAKKTLGIYYTTLGGG